MNNNNTTTCECTEAYYLAEENHWEPSHQCKACADYDAYLENEIEEYNAIRRELEERGETTHDLPF